VLLAGDSAIALDTILKSSSVDYIKVDLKARIDLLAELASKDVAHGQNYVFIKGQKFTAVEIESLFYAGELEAKLPESAKKETLD
jgi:Grx4 family monothiol glutaredoxin